jgi:hypothetical protein
VSVGVWILLETLGVPYDSLMRVLGFKSWSLWKTWIILFTLLCISYYLRCLHANPCVFELFLEEFCLLSYLYSHEIFSINNMNSIFV